MNKKKALFLGVLCIVLIIVACFFALNRKDKINETSAEKVEQEKSATEEAKKEVKKETKRTEVKKKKNKAKKEEKTDTEDASQQSSDDTDEIYVGPLVDKDSGAQETGPKESQAEPVEFPYDVPGTGITVQNISSYSGIYVEDGSDQEISNVSAMQMYNSGSNAVEYVSVSVKCNGEQLEFEASDIPAGASVMVQEKNKKAYQSGTYTECVGTAAKVDGFGMSEDKVQVTPNEDNTFTVTNLTEETIPCVRIFYKLYMEDKGIYVGGITYNVKVTELEAGTSQTVSPSHYAQGYSRLMMVRTYDTTE